MSRSRREDQHNSHLSLPHDSRGNAGGSPSHRSDGSLGLSNDDNIGYRGRAWVVGGSGRFIGGRSPSSRTRIHQPDDFEIRDNNSNPSWQQNTRTSGRGGGNNNINYYSSAAISPRNSQFLHPETNQSSSRNSFQTLQPPAGGSEAIIPAIREQGQRRQGQAEAGSAAAGNYNSNNSSSNNNNNNNNNNTGPNNNKENNKTASQEKRVRYQDNYSENNSSQAQGQGQGHQEQHQHQEQQRHHHHRHHHHHDILHHYHRPHFNSVVYQPSSGRRPFWQLNGSQTAMAENGNGTHQEIPANNFLRPGDLSVAIDIEPASSPSRANSETSSLSSQMLSALRQRARRLTASTNYQDYNKMIGAEPGVDLKQEIDVDLYADCGITVVDFDKETLTQTELNNLSLLEFLNQPRPSWSKVRWINVNGLSFDVIKALGQYKALHRLAIEDLMNTKNRTKCDWYSDHTFIILTLQKLVNIHQAVTSEELKQRRSFWARLGGWRAPNADSDEEEECEEMLADPHSPGHKLLKSLQRYHGGPNAERTLYMERHSSLASRNLAVSVEQVGIFLTDDNIVVSFFENSADDIEPPILARLQSTNTLLRTAEDASMVLQAILDAIVDLSFPIIHAYQDTIGDLELHVLTEPSLEHTSALYIITSELSLLKITLQPIVSVINALRDHIREHSRKAMEESGSFFTSVEVSQTTHTYLGDVQDHCVMLLDVVETMKRSADNLTDLLFNIMGNLQNESMKTLTLVTVLFLPMSFLTGYFGMNFTKFSAIENSDVFFWKIGAPVVVVTILFLMYDHIKRFFILAFRKRQIKQVRKMRLAKAAIEKAKLKRAGTYRPSTSSRRSGDARTTGTSVVVNPPPTSRSREKETQ